MNQRQQIDQYCRQYKITGMAAKIEQMVQKAESEQLSYLGFLLQLFEQESLHREFQAKERLLKTAKLPANSSLNQYQHREETGLTLQKINTLKEMDWLDQIYNIMLLGPSGVGKSFFAAGLCAQAIEKGYKAYFRTMDDILNMLRMKDFARAAMADHKRLTKANLIVIDDIMLFPVEKTQAVNLFNFINQLYENTSFIITTNKMPADWAKMLDDEVLATALLDRLLFRCEVINLAGKSYRMENRKTIFGT